MIDIDASLQAAEITSTFWVYFDDPGQSGDKLGFEVKADPQKQRKIIERGIKISTNYRSVDAGDMQITADWVGVALALTDYLIGWDGFVGVFAREKVKAWFEKYPSYALAFSQQFKQVLDSYEADTIKRKDAEAKN